MATLEIKHGDYKAFTFNVTQGGSPYSIATHKIMFRAANTHGAIAKSSDVPTQIEKTGDSSFILHIEAEDTTPLPNVPMDLDYDIQIVTASRPITVSEGFLRVSREITTGG